jgi:hypothetical protein
MSTPRQFRQINTADRELQLIQSNVEKAISGAISSPLLNGLLKTADLVSGLTSIEHKLGRVPQGYIIIDKNNAANVYTASKDDKFLNLNSSAACKIGLWIF